MDHTGRPCLKSMQHACAVSPSGYSQVPRRPIVTFVRVVGARAPLLRTPATQACMSTEPSSSKVGLIRWIRAYELPVNDDSRLLHKEAAMFKDDDDSGCAMRRTTAVACRPWLQPRMLLVVCCTTRFALGVGRNCRLPGSTCGYKR